jgi:chromosome partitioning protein
MMFVVSLVCQKGGAGKSTLAIHLAIEGYLRGLKTLLHDIDPQQSTTKIMQRRGDDPPDASNGQATWVRQVVDEARAEGYELVVIDTAALADQSALKAAQVSDLVLIPVRPTVMDVDAIATSQDICALARKPSLFVLNAVPPQGTESDETQALIEGRGGEVAPVRIGARKPYAQAFNSGRGAQEMLPASVAAREIKVLYDLLHGVMVLRSHTSGRATVGAHA